MDKTKSGRRRAIFWQVSFLICLLVFLCCVGYLFLEYRQKQQRSEVYNELIQKAKRENDGPQAGTIETMTIGKTTSPEEVDETANKEPETESPIDFEMLSEVNEDIYAWIEIPDTKVDYPIVQDEEDNLYYLDHTIEGEEGYPGSIYTENYNKKDFSDRNTVIYGHNMKDGSMFGDLSEYMDSDYMEKHPYIYVYTPTETLKYEIFAGITYDNRHILETYDFEEDDQYQEFLDSVFEVRNMESYIREDIEVTTEDKILTLSTCVSGNRKELRFLVEAVLIDEP